MTNARRFAQGLPPLAPRKLWVPSNSEAAARARRSPAPPGTAFTCPSNVAAMFAECCTSYDVATGVGAGCDNVLVRTNNCACVLPISRRLIHAYSF
ncbi:hypothetical protein CALCODRAFT_491180 [Calocera cornea HHB12733]|uniref:Uncharacterized protein n=1 Tax=Calocera cornea HHB12733 TaxID=1353952 RepID=A0A165J4Y9_9BASI|nr:hypothetical protein CALCODRAFT_491180 [Calocera cornea HHB12733]